MWGGVVVGAGGCIQGVDDILGGQVRHCGVCMGVWYCVHGELHGVI